MRRGPDASYELSPEAIDDIAEALNYLDAESPAAVERLQTRLTDAFLHLAAWPHSGHTRNDLTSRAVRFWAVDPYLVVYRLAGKTLQIVAVLHASRDLEWLLEDR